MLEGARFENIFVLPFWSAKLNDSHDVARVFALKGSCVRRV
jgi:hypothetical protein